MTESGRGGPGGSAFDERKRGASASGGCGGCGWDKRASFLDGKKNPDRDNSGIEFDSRWLCCNLCWAIKSFTA